MINKLYHGDCLMVLDEIASASVDFIFCDLPYGITAATWDDPLSLSELWKHYNRIIKPVGTIAMMGSQPFTSELIQSNRKNYRYCWYWIKNQGTNFFHAKRMPIRKVEEIIIFNRGLYHPQMIHNQTPTSSAIGVSFGNTYHGTNKRNYKGGDTTRFPTNVLEFKCVSNYERLHSAQKPVELLEYLILTYTNKGMVVLDSCAGSGTTGLACQNTDRRFILIEKDFELCGIIEERLNIKSTP